MSHSNSDSHLSDGSVNDSETDEILVDGSTLNSLLADRAAKRRRLARKAELARISRAKKKSKIEELESQVATLQREIALEEEKVNNQSINAENQVNSIDRLLAIHSSTRAEIEAKLQAFQSHARSRTFNQSINQSTNQSINQSNSQKELIKLIDLLACSVREELDSGIDAFSQLRTVLSDTQIQALIGFIETHGEILLSAR